MVRKTRQREAIRQVLSEHPHPLGPRDILRRARRRVPSLGIATVYRALRDLVEEGWLIAVELPGHPPLYERSDKRHHHHFACRRCGRLHDVYACSRDLMNLVPGGFVLEDHKLVLHGVCESCNTSRRHR